MLRIDGWETIEREICNLFYINLKQETSSILTSPDHFLAVNSLNWFWTFDLNFLHARDITEFCLRLTQDSLWDEFPKNMNGWVTLSHCITGRNHRLNYIQIEVNHHKCAMLILRMSTEDREMKTLFEEHNSYFFEHWKSNRAYFSPYLFWTLLSIEYFEFIIVWWYHQKLIKCWKN